MYAGDVSGAMEDHRDGLPQDRGEVVGLLPDDLGHRRREDVRRAVRLWRVGRGTAAMSVRSWRAVTSPGGRCCTSGQKVSRAGSRSTPSTISAGLSGRRSAMNPLRQHAPADHADLAGPATEQMLAAAEERMGIPLPQDLRAWLLQNNLDLPEEDADDDVACCGFAGFPDEGNFFLGIRAVEKLLPLREVFKASTQRHRSAVGAPSCPTRPASHPG
ncbi:SMI1/KNR4 family protein [Streptomyces sp. NPDC051064]|uniref:SMI1/KNR4 family protein n=1 Tax=Streptomyces sp. NPDC051064 TaxID=3365641 RepID=UPI0037978960